MFEGEEAFTGLPFARLINLLDSTEETVEGPFVLDFERDLNFVYYDSLADMHCNIPLTCTSRTGQRGRPVIMDAGPTLVRAAVTRMEEMFAVISESTRLDLGKKLGFVPRSRSKHQYTPCRVFETSAKRSPKYRHVGSVMKPSCIVEAATPTSTCKHCTAL